MAVKTKTAQRDNKLPKAAICNYLGQRKNLFTCADDDNTLVLNLQAQFLRFVK